MPVRVPRTSIIAGPLVRAALGTLFGLLALPFPAARGAEVAAEGPTFDQRVEIQRRIEEIRWAHRLWPEQNPEPKPPLSAVMPDSVLRAKVDDALRMSNALESYWGRPVTGEQLQAEIDRMVRDTK